VALCAEFLVSSIDEMVASSGVSLTFIGLIVLPIVGNAAEVYQIGSLTIACHCRDSSVQKQDGSRRGCCSGIINGTLPSFLTIANCPSRGSLYCTFGMDDRSTDDIVL
jgi:hypothetical protein